MTYYLISFPSDAMVVSDEEFAQAVHDSHAVVEAAKVAGVWVFGGGILDSVAPVRVAADGSVVPGAYPEHEQLPGGFAVLETVTREDAEAWAARFATVCRCPQEVWQFGDDPES